MYKYNLSGKTLIVTGAETGIGRAIARRAVRDGASVTAAGINEEGLREVFDTAEKNVIQVVCIDDTDAAAIVNYSVGKLTADTTP